METLTQTVIELIQQHVIDNDPITTFLVPALKIVAIIIVSIIILRYSGHWVDRLFSLRRIDEQRSQTLAKLFKSFIYYAVYFIAALTILINIGLDPTPVLAGAGILGLAIGFGAQSLVKDVITGFFLIFENQLQVNDYVEINGEITGTVEEIGLRVTKIREWNERLHYFSNGEITRVANFNRDQMRPIVNVVVPFEEDQTRVMQLLEGICQKIAQQYEGSLLESPSIYGISTLDQDGIHYTIMTVSIPDQYWEIMREMRRMIIHDFQNHHIDMFYARHVLYEDSQAMRHIHEKQRED